MKLQSIGIENIIHIHYHSGEATSKYSYICKYFKAGLKYTIEISV